MPIYEYQCRKCGSRTEVLQRMDAPHLERCDACGGELRRLLSAPSFQLKGSGWYVTDYARKGGADGSKEPANGKAASASAGDGKQSGTEANGKGPEAAAAGSGTKASDEASGSAPAKAANRPDPGTS